MDVNKYEYVVKIAVLFPHNTCMHNVFFPLMKYDQQRKTVVFHAKVCSSADPSIPIQLLQPLHAECLLNVNVTFRHLLMLLFTCVCVCVRIWPSELRLIFLSITFSFLVVCMYVSPMTDWWPHQFQLGLTPANNNPHMISRADGFLIINKLYIFLGLLQFYT